MCYLQLMLQYSGVAYRDKFASNFNVSPQLVNAFVAGWKEKEKKSAYRMALNWAEMQLHDKAPGLAYIFFDASDSVWATLQRNLETPEMENVAPFREWMEKLPISHRTKVAKIIAAVVTNSRVPLVVDKDFDAFNKSLTDDRLGFYLKLVSVPEAAVGQTARFLTKYEKRKNIVDRRRWRLDAAGRFTGKGLCQHVQKPGAAPSRARRAE